MASYAGVTFSERYNSGRLALWRPVRNLSERHYPHSNANNVQDGGLSNYTLTVLAYLTDEADLAALLAAQGITGRTLVYRGVTYNNVLLWEVGEAQELQSAGTDFEVSLEFRRAP